MTTLEVLQAARALLSDPERWTQKVFAEDKNGEIVPEWSKAACKFCAVGAVGRDRNAHGAMLPENYHALELLQLAAYPNRPFSVNDYGGHEAVLEMYDHAIELAREENA